MDINWKFSSKLSDCRRSNRNLDCLFYIGNDTTGNPAYLKKAYNGRYPNVYREKFDTEFSRMSKIKSKLFPKYYETSSNLSHNSPYIIMEYFPSNKFITLEEYLCKQPAPYGYSEKRLIEDKLFRALLISVHEALKILFNRGLLYLDLYPENILINPETGDIRLVDFTDCYDVNSKETPIFKLADENLNPKSPPAVLLTQQFGLLIARLHYPGNSAYGNFPIDVKIFTAQYYPMFDDILRHNNKDPMEENYWLWKYDRKDAFTMYEDRYQKFMEEFNSGRFRNSP